jgi:hypothetical protein
VEIAKNSDGPEKRRFFFWKPKNENEKEKEVKSKEL